MAWDKRDTGKVNCSAGLLLLLKDGFLESFTLSHQRTDLINTFIS